MGREITFRLNEPADEKVTRANFLGQNGTDMFILNNVELTINQKLGLVEKESWEAAIRQALNHSRESSSQSGGKSKCLVKMQLVRQDPPDQSDWEELFVYEHEEDDCPHCDFPIAEEVSLCIFRVITLLISFVKTFGRLGNAAPPRPLRQMAQSQRCTLGTLNPVTKCFIGLILTSLESCMLDPAEANLNVKSFS